MTSYICKKLRISVILVFLFNHDDQLSAMYKPLLSTVISLFFFSFNATAQTAWKDVPESTLTQSGMRFAIPDHYRTVQIDSKVLEKTLASAPLDNSSTPLRNTSILSLPNPTGGTDRYYIAETPVMAPELQAKYPQIRTYTGYGIDDPTARLKCDLTPHGFHAMIRSGLHGTSLIEPYSMETKDHAIVYYKKDHRRLVEAPRFSCGVPAQVSDELSLENKQSAAGVQDHGGALNDGKKRKYRLALSCTGEYAEFHGGTKALILAAMVTSMHRVNGVYENEFAVTMEIIAKNDTLIFLNADTDPFENDNGGAMLGQNRTTCDTRIGTLGYDMGHVFSTGGGGVAGLGVICTAIKAHGVTGQPAPIGDFFDIDYVAHEMGHQFSGNHTQNNSCNRADDTAVEPGSASTIMGYAGICAPDVQEHSDDYFHGINVEEIATFILTGAGNNCPVKTSTGNTPPTVNAGPDILLPRGTPFFITATGSDPDGDKVTFCWEQMDADEGIMPPSATSVRGPLFRSFLPDTSPVRMMPRLASLVAGANLQWERLPGVGRTLKLRVIARDNHPGGGATNWDDMVINVSNTAGPFRVSAPNSLVFWRSGEIRQITWDVAATDVTPINCKLVNISLSADGGMTYPIKIAQKVPNNGRYCFKVPDTLITRARIRIDAVDNIFYDISNTNFQIRPAIGPAFTVCGGESAAQVCLPNKYTTSLVTGSVMNFESPVTFTATGLPPGATATFMPNPVLPGQDVQVTVQFPDGTAEATFPVGFKGKSGTDSMSVNTKLTVVSNDFAALATLSPIYAAMGLPQSQILRWRSVAAANTYEVQVATNPAFEAAAIVFSKENIAADSAKTPLLEKNRLYFWRVRAQNECGKGNWAETSIYSTIAESCAVFIANDLPKNISANNIATVESTITLNANAVISDINVKKIEGNHTFFRDLKMTLLSPTGAAAQLFTGKCGNFNGKFAFSFDDEAANELVCPPNAAGNAFKPLQPFSKFKSENSLGAWKLKVEDLVAGSGGQLAAFEIEVCAGVALNPPFIVVNNPLELAGGTKAPIVSALLKTEDPDNTAAQLTYTLVTIPTKGTLSSNNGPALTIGDQFTQADIDNGLIRYSDNNIGFDQFRFVVTDGQGGFFANTFYIRPVIVAVEEPYAQDRLDFYLSPNPATDNVSIQFSRMPEDDILLQLYDMTGRSIQAMTVNQGTSLVSFALNHIPSGVYWVQAGEKVKKLVVR